MKRNLTVLLSIFILIISALMPGVYGQSAATACDAILANNRGATPHVVDLEDWFKFADSYPSQQGDSYFNPRADFNKDNKINFFLGKRTLLIFIYRRYTEVNTRD